jgi:phytoene desaturase
MATALRKEFHKMDHPSTSSHYLTILVIGAGIGGITTAARLARLGFHVTVAEKCDHAGGRCGYLVKDGHHFDTGPTLFLMPELYAQAFSDLGERMQDHLDLRRIDPTYHLHFDDGTTLALTSDMHAMQTQLENIEPGSFGAFLRYLNEGHLHYKLSLTHLVKRNFRSPLEFYNPKTLLLLFKLKALIKHYDNIGRYFHDNRLKAAFTFQNMYMGLNPCEAPAIFSLLQYTELADGIWYPMGGMHQIIKALMGIAEKHGVQFMYNSPVKQINVDSRRTSGVTLADGRQLRADVVVANADLAYVYRDLLPNDGTAARLEHKKYGCSVVVFYWGVDKLYPQLGPHNLFLASDYRHSFDPIFKDLTLPDEPNFYIHAPTRVDPSLAPHGQDTLMVAIPVGHINDNAPQDWIAIQKRAQRVVLQRLEKIGISDLDEHIKFELSFTPPDWKRHYNLSKGSAHGLSHDLLQMGYLRPHNRHPHYRNLYFVGASTHPGTGLPTVLVSSRLTTERILKDADISKNPQ